MDARTLLNSVSPVTQSIEAVVELLNCLGRPADPLPGIVDLGNVKLVRSNKGEVFYCVTAKGCSCPGAPFRGQPIEEENLFSFLYIPAKTT
jgi:hypothetical protein